METLYERELTACRRFNFLVNCVSPRSLSRNSLGTIRLYDLDLI